MVVCRMGKGRKERSREDSRLERVSVKLMNVKIQGPSSAGKCWELNNVLGEGRPGCSQGVFWISL